MRFSTTKVFPSNSIRSSVHLCLEIFLTLSSSWTGNCLVVSAVSIERSQDVEWLLRADPWKGPSIARANRARVIARIARYWGLEALYGQFYDSGVCLSWQDGTESERELRRPTESADQHQHAHTRIRGVALTMPTINAYKHDRGYYIRAWTSELGNINYKLRSGGNKIIEEYGLDDGDDISWDTIHSLKAIGEIYTEGSGTLGPDEFASPDGDVKSLTEEEAERLLRSILDENDPSEDQIEELCSILGIEKPTSRVEELERELESRIVARGGLDYLDTEETLNGDPDEWSFWASFQGVEGSENPPVDCTINLFFLGDTALDHPGIARHDIYLCSEHGLEAWSFAYSGEDEWKCHAEMASQKSDLMPLVINWLDELGVEYGTPAEEFGTGENKLLQ